MEIPIKMDDLGVPPFSENPHVVPRSMLASVVLLMIVLEWSDES